MNSHPKIIILSLLMGVCFKAQILRADLCNQFLGTPDMSLISALEHTLANGQDFVTAGFSTWSYRANGCGAVCALNLVQGLRLQAEIKPQSPNDQANSVFKFIDPDFKPGVFGSHGQPKEMTGLSTGRLGHLIQHLLDEAELSQSYQVEAFQRFDHEALLAGEDIQFKNYFTLNDVSHTDTKTSKIILVSVSDLDKPSTHSYLTAHFYSVVKFENDILYLHDPNIKNRVFRFELIPYKSGPFDSFQMIPLDSDYKIVQSFPPNLHYMINGIVSVVKD
jgi:hypothetical protein